MIRRARKQKLEERSEGAGDIHLQAKWLKDRVMFGTSIFEDKLPQVPPVPGFGIKILRIFVGIPPFGGKKVKKTIVVMNKRPRQYEFMFRTSCASGKDLTVDEDRFQIDVTVGFLPTGDDLRRNRIDIESCRHD